MAHKHIWSPPPAPGPRNVRIERRVQRRTLRQLATPTPQRQVRACLLHIARLCLLLLLYCFVTCLQRPVC